MVSKLVNVSVPFTPCMIKLCQFVHCSTKLPTHTLRHSYRSWLDAVGTPIAVQQKLVRHSDIRTTMNLYGDVVTDEMAQAHSKVVGLALIRAD